MPSLPTSGIEMVAKGASEYISDIDRAAKATDKFGDGLGSVAGKAGGFSTVMTGALMRVGEVAVDALGRAAQATGQFLADSVTSAADVEQILAVMGATSGATAAQLEQVRDTAIALGGDLSLPATSAQDATDAMLALTKAGFSVDEAMAAAKGTLQLAAAAEISAGEAAEISASQINAFGLAASDSAHVADLLAGAANAAQGTMTDMAQGFQQGGFAFHQAGQSIDTMAASVTALVKVGLTGSDAGTALKNALMRLMNPTEKAAGLMRDLGFSAYDAQGNMKPMETIIGELNAAMAGMTNQERDATLGTIFLSDGMKAMTPLLALGKDGFIALRDEVSKTGSATTIAGAQTQGFNGAIAGLQSQMETLQLIIGTKLLPLLTPLIQKFSEGAAKVAEFLDTFLGLAPAIAESTDPINTFFNILRISTDDTWNPLIGKIQEFVGVARTIGDALAGGDIAGAFAAVAPMVQSGIDTIVPIIESVGRDILAQVNTWVTYLGQWIIDALPGMGANMALFAQDLYMQIGAALPGIVANLAIWGQRFSDWVVEALPLMLMEMGTYVASMIGFLLDNLPAIVAQLATWGAMFVSWLVDVIPKLIAAAGELLVAFLNWVNDSTPGLNAKLALWQKQFVAWITEVTPKVIAELGKLWAELVAYLDQLAGKAKADGTVGAAIIDGIKKGLREGLASVKEAAEEIAQAALSAAKSALGISSPSKVFEMQVGYQMSAGIAEGILAKSGLINSALATVTTAPIAKPSSGGGSSSTTNSRVLNFSPVYGGSVRPPPAMDVSLARSLAL